MLGSPEFLRGFLETNSPGGWQFIGQKPQNVYDFREGCFVSFEKLEKDHWPFLPPVPWWHGYTFHSPGNKATDHSTMNLLKAFYKSACNPDKEAISRILGVLPAVHIPFRKMNIAMIETPSFMLTVKLTGGVTVTSQKSLINQVTVSPFEKSVEVDSGELFGQVSGAFDVDCNHLTSLPTPKISIKNKSFGTEVSANFRLKFENPLILEFITEAKVSRPRTEIFDHNGKSFAVTLEFGYEADLKIRKNGKNRRDNPFDGVECPKLVPLGALKPMRNYFNHISEDWKQLINPVDFSLKNVNNTTTTPWNKDHNRLRHHTQIEMQRPYKVIWTNQPGFQNDGSRITHPYLRVFLLPFSELAKGFALGAEYRESVGQAVWEGCEKFMYETALPFLQDNWEALKENPAEELNTIRAGIGEAIIAK